MDILAAINGRASAATLAEPAPTREHIQSILEAGARAPDHGKMGPWRFVVIEAAAREKLVEAMQASLRAKNPEADEIELKRERDKVMRAPTIITVAARIKKGHKIPESEQLLAVGAATQNMFLAAQALGYGAMWKTGDAAYDPSIKTALGLEADDEIVAFLYLGTTGIPGKVRAPVLDDRVKWL
jgi:nitroreductase